MKEAGLPSESRASTHASFTLYLVIDKEFAREISGLYLEWTEEGGPLVAEPDKRGFGTRMIERGLASELQGEVTLHFHLLGLQCIIDAPLPKA